jgi:hypothetical protein
VAVAFGGVIDSGSSGTRPVIEIRHHHHHFQAL